MLNSEEILNLLKNCPQGYLKPDHNLFTMSNCSLLQPYKKLGAISSKDEVFNDSLGSPANEIFCNVFGCSMVFDNIASYQSHYNVAHRFICAECKKSQPTDHLLDLHISENHDSYFKARLERGERLYKCYLEECKEVFENPSERKEHCMKQHKFPNNFRFDQIFPKKSQNMGGKTSKKDSKQIAMQLVEDPISKDHKELKMISFGHQREKTFRPRNVPTQKPDNGKPLEDMDSLKEALEWM